MTDDKARIPGEFLIQAYDHAERTGQPFLRDQRLDDEVTVVASGGGGLSFDLSVEEDDTLLSSIETWTDLADCYFDIPLPILLEKLAERGYPEGWLPDLTENEEDWGYPEVWTARDLLPDLIPGTTLRKLLSGLPTEFEWDSTTADPGLSFNIEEVREWLERGVLSGITETAEMRSGCSEPVIWVPSATALTCLQYVLDQLDRRTWIRVFD